MAGIVSLQKCMTPFVAHLDIQKFVHRALLFTLCGGISIVSSVFIVWPHWASGLGSDDGRDRIRSPWTCGLAVIPSETI